MRPAKLRTHPCYRSPSTIVQADFYMERTPPHGLPPNDWEEPNPSLPYESSAAAVAAVGLLELSLAVSEPSKAEYYRKYAFKALRLAH
jgi:unsaturated chondroitin disaccharide hydrolase